MRYLAAALVLLSVSCAGPQVAPEVLRIVPLIKAERYDEAGVDPEKLAPAFVQALRELMAEGADPKRIVAVANFFFEHYPFCVRDLVVDEPLFIEVAELQYGALTRLHPETPACAEFRRRRTVDEFSSVRFEDPHVDGGRCARHIYEIFRTATRDGSLIKMKPELFRWGPGVEGHAGDLEYLHKSFVELSAPTPWFIASSLCAARLNLDSDGPARYEAWRRFGLFYEPWHRLIESRYAWLHALKVGGEPIYYGIGKQLAASRFDSRLREIGLAMVVLDRTDSDDIPKTLEALDFLIRSGRGTPFADWARLEALTLRGRKGLWTDAEAWLRANLGQFDSPLFAAYGLLYLADFDHVEPRQKIALAREALNLHPTGTSAVSAWGELAGAYSNLGLKDEGVDCLKKALAGPTGATDIYEDNVASAARDSAGVGMALHYEEVGDWSRALEAWRSWKPHYGHHCGEEGEGIYITQKRAPARCLEGLGRLQEAASYYWDVVNHPYWNDMESTKRLREIHRSLGTDDTLREKLRASIAGKTKIKDDLKWLAEELGVPLK